MSIQLDKAGDRMSVSNVDLVAGTGSNRHYFSPEYVASVDSLSGNSYKVNFSFPGFIYTDSTDLSFVNPPQEDIQPDTLSQVLSFPFYRDVSKLSVYDNNRRLKMEHDLSDYRICEFDGKCSFGESVDSCPEDCLAGENVKAESKILPEDMPEQAEPTGSSSQTYIIVIAGVAALAGILFLALRQRK